MTINGVIAKVRKNDFGRIEILVFNTEMKGRLVIEIFHKWHFKLSLFIYDFMIL